MARAITPEMLRNACRDQRDEFARRFSVGVKLNSEAEAVELARSVANVFDWEWAAEQFLSRPAREAYEAARRSAWEAYMAVERPAWEAYEAATRPAREAYEAKSRPAWEAYLAAERLAWEAYMAASGPAREAYMAAKAEAFARAFMMGDV